MVIKYSEAKIESASIIPKRVENNVRVNAVDSKLETNVSLNIQKKKILHIVEAMGGGVFTYLADLVNQLCNDYEVYIAYAIRPQTPTDYQKYFDDRVRLIEVKNFMRSIDFSKDVKAFFEIKRIEKEVQPDIIHLHSSKAGVLGRWAFSGHKIPVFYTPHGYSFLMQNYGQIKRSVYKKIELISSKRNCTIISCSPGEHKESLKLTNKSTYVNNGIDVEALSRLVDRYREGTEQDHPFTVFTLGRICHQKNPELFNAVAERLPNIKFKWIGDGELREVLTSSNIEVTGWIEREVALKHSTRSDVFMLTSLWEGLPISLLEAMFMKKICVVSNVIGNKDVIKNGINGFVCDSVDEFAEAIENIYLKKENSHRIIDNAYNDILSEYNLVVMANHYRRIYEEVK